ncbi:MAG: hypothetical protein M9953_03295 [Thermomicrobiales bacterium]|nr:hypothetical protein [Thermomicrobiales bacterium]MCO5217978.1 hypothetical protein [Thermomicrobiales bacterium]MCO5224343.1 hypothetical protein [Thermomicrobiales bacterium]
MFDTSRIPTGPFDTWLWWLLILVVVALLFSLQALETAVEGAWPHQRHDNEYIPGARGVKGAWALAAILIVPGGVALIGVIAVLIWRDYPYPDGFALGGWLLALGWLFFLMFGLNWLGMGKVLGSLGMLGPLAISFILIAANLILFVTLRSILPPWDVTREAMQNGIHSLLPYIDFE